MSGTANGAAANGAAAVELPDKAETPFTRGPCFEWTDQPFRNGVCLSTYADCIGSDLKSLKRFLDLEALAGALQGVHLLPVYRSNADRGFAPANYHEIDPKFGTWEDVKALAGEYDMTVEFMSNHIGSLSEQFQDFKKKGQASEFKDLFVMWDDVFQGQEATACELASVYTRKPEFPYQVVKHEDGSESKIWNTFGKDQIDIDTLRSDVGAKFLESAFDDICRTGPKIVRMDAVGYVTKERGTDCFFLEPSIWERLAQFKEQGDKHGVQLVAEVHEHYTLRTKLANAGYWVYDFCLPMLVLHALHQEDVGALKRWLQICPFRQITCLDTHDGIGVPDVEDVMTPKQITQTEDSMCGCKELMQWTYDPEADEFKERSTTHQHNCTFFSSIQGRGNWYVLARAIQMFTPGVPMVYYVGLLAGTNDNDLAEEMESERYLNRHYYGEGEAADRLQAPVVSSLLKLLRFRNQHTAFNGEMEVKDTPDHELTIKWVNGDAWARLEADLTSKVWTIEHSPLEGGGSEAVTLHFEGIDNEVACDQCQLSDREEHMERIEARHARLEAEGKMHFADA